MTKTIFILFILYYYKFGRRIASTSKYCITGILSLNAEHIMLCKVIYYYIIILYLSTAHADSICAENVVVVVVGKNAFRTL